MNKLWQSARQLFIIFEVWINFYGLSIRNLFVISKLIVIINGKVIFILAFYDFPLIVVMFKVQSQ
jgi:hypothetical protein